MVILPHISEYFFLLKRIPTLASCVRKITSVEMVQLLPILTRYGSPAEILLNICVLSPIWQPSLRKCFIINELPPP